MTVQDEIRQRIEKDALLARLRKKIDSGKGTYADSFAYSDRAGKLLGEIFSRRLPDIPLEEREALCVELLRDRYTDINALCDRVQKALDEAQGLHLAPQHAPFNGERAHQIGSSLRDLSKSVETLQRRAESAPATATRAMHDDRMKAESKFRSRAGLKCWITRKTDGKCCEWCDKMAGRFEYGDEPDDIYRRHDNCGCTVTFENGRKRQDVWSKRTWEAPEPGAGAGERVVLTEEQARELEAKHLPMVLTNGGESGSISVEVDEFVPCLKDAATGEILPTEVAKISRKDLKKFTEAGGWGDDWKDRPKDEYVLGVFIQGESEPQGLISLRADEHGLYMSFASTAPHNNKQITGGSQKYIGVGGHLFAAAIQESVRTGNGGAVYGFAANEELLNYYIHKFGAFYCGVLHPYHFFIADEAAQRIIDIYNFERR